MHLIQSKPLLRKDFIRMAALGGLGLYLGACGADGSKKAEAVVTPPKDTVGSKPAPAISKAGDGDVVFYTAKDALYEDLRHGFNKRFDKHPAVIALCKTTDGVAAALAAAHKNGQPVAIKSGGHCTEGFSVNDGGMVINLSAINGVELLNDGRVKVGPGVKLAQLYDTLFPQKRLIPAGACGTVGVGGLSLGGGYGFFSRQYGLSCDHISELTMVDAKGNVHTAREGDELLWACKGGGNGNFGVVTEIVFRSHPAPETFQSHRFRAFNVDEEKAGSIIEQWFSIAANLPANCFSALVLNTKTVYILLTNFGKLTTEIQAVITALTNLTDKAHVGSPIITAQALKAYYGATQPCYFKNSSAGLYSGYNEIKSFIHQVISKVIHTPGMIYQLGTLGGNIDNKDFEKASAYPHRAKHFVSELQTYWQQPAQGERLMNSFAEVQDIFMSNGILAQYCNYPYIGFKDWQHAYYGNNYTRLQAVKSQYDPENIIRSEQSVKVGA